MDQACSDSKPGKLTFKNNGKSILIAKKNKRKEKKINGPSETV